jgi:hypothetical protein
LAQLHLDVDADAHEVIADELSPDEVGNVSESVELLSHVSAPVASVIINGTYDRGNIQNAMNDRRPEADTISPPWPAAVSSTSVATQRHRHIEAIEKAASF